MAISVRPRTDRSFERSSPVARYWLAQCEGFRVDGGVKGTVEQVEGTSDAQRPEVLVVRRALRRQRVPVADVAAVVPAARLITIEGARPETAPDRARSRALATARSRAVPVAVSLVGGATVVARRVADVAFTVLMIVAATLFAFAAFLSKLAVYAVHQLVTTAREWQEASARRQAEARASRRRRARPDTRLRERER